MLLLFHTQFFMKVGTFVHQFIEGKLITNWKNWENKNTEFVSVSVILERHRSHVLTPNKDKILLPKIMKR